MTTATTTNVPRVLTPVAEYFSHDGAAFVRLTPSKSLKNAAIIYESIKNLPDKTLVRGDFDRKTRPYIFFPKRTKKKIGLGGSLDTQDSQCGLFKLKVSRYRGFHLISKFALSAQKVELIIVCFGRWGPLSANPGFRAGARTLGSSGISQTI